jgi:3,4-dihydroxy 2-butanone 4-phosphate synthase / GTP cyclohydrolase II
VIGELTAEDGTMRSGRSLRAFAEEHGLLVLEIADLVRHRRATGGLVEPVTTSAMPTAFGDFRAVGYRHVLDGTEHLALVMGDVAAAGTPTGVPSSACTASA